MQNADDYKDLEEIVRLRKRHPQTFESVPSKTVLDLMKSDPIFRSEDFLVTYLSLVKVHLRSVRYLFRITEPLRERTDRAAAKMGLKLSEFIIRAMVKALVEAERDD